MATFKLGAIVTDIVGSIGGTTFKRGASVKIIMNKSGGASKNKNYQNQRLGSIAVIFRQWSQLTDVQRSGWNASALLFQFPDKFGTLRNITGRQLFTKLNVQLLPAGYGVIDSTGIHNNMEAFTLTTSFVSASAPYAIINKTGSNVVQNFFIQADVTQKNIYGPNFNKKKSFFSDLSSVDASVDIWNSFIENFPYFDATYQVAFYVCIINEWGFKSVTQFVKATVTA